VAVDRTERLLNLVITLISARRPVSRDTIRRGVPGYAESASDQAFERMFERDKDELRSMGVPIEAVGPEGEIEGYLIRRSEYALTLDLTRDECAALALAAAAWDSATDVGVARGAVRKVEGGVPFPAVAEAPVAFHPSRTSAAAALPPLLDAVRQRRRVRFDYRKAASDQTETRHLEPWAVISWRRAWYVIGRDGDRGERRVFRLSRIAGPVVLEGRGGAFAPPDDGSYRSIVEEWASAEMPERAVVDVDPGQAARLRLIASDEEPGLDSIRLTIPFRDEEALVAEVLAAGDGAEVISPAHLRRTVESRLAESLRRHS
jgi:proteasome accessory factor B